MAKVLIARNLYDTLKRGSGTFLDRADVRVFTADSNEEVIRIHRTEKADLIITQIDMPGMNSERMFAEIRADKAAHPVPVIMVCTNNPGEIEKCARCGVSDVILRPVNQKLLLSRAQQFLALFTRESARAAMSADIEAFYRGQFFSCRSLDVGASGMMIETEKNLARGDSIACSFYLPDGSRIRTDAEVVNAPQPLRETRRRRYGMRFINLPGDAQKALQAFVAMQSRVAA